MWRNLLALMQLVYQFKDNHEFSSNYIFPIILKNSDFKIRNKVREQLAEDGIQTSVHYPAVHRFSIYKDFYSSLPITEYVADNLITLPMFGKLQKHQIEMIITKLNLIIK